MTNTDTGLVTDTEEREDAKHPCACGNYRIDLDSQEQVDAIPGRLAWTLDPAPFDEAGWRYMETGCTTLTRKTFAPGHDARLKGLMQFAHRVSAAVSTQGGLSGSAEVMARPFGFAHMVTAPVAPRKPRAAKTIKVEVETRAADGLTIKVGRWEYAGTLVEGGATYLNGKGEIQFTPTGHFKVIN